MRSFKIFGALLQKAGPYLLLEILLPGGTLFALLLFLYKRRQQDGAEMPRAIFVVARAIDKVHAEIVYVARLYGIASLWRGRARERDGLEALAIAARFLGTQPVADRAPCGRGGAGSSSAASARNPGVGERRGVSRRHQRRREATR